MYKEFFESLIDKNVIVVLKEDLYWREPDKCFPFTKYDSKFYLNHCNNYNEEPHLVDEKTHLLVEIY